MKRIDKRGITLEQLGLKGHGGLFDAFDDAIKSAYRMTDEEYDYICENAKDDELDYLIGEDHTFSDKRKVVEILEKYFTQFHNVII